MRDMMRWNVYRIYLKRKRIIISATMLRWPPVVASSQDEDIEQITRRGRF